MKILDRFFYFLYSFSRKHRDTNDHIGANVLLISILLTFNLLSILNLIDILSELTIRTTKLIILILLLIIYGVCSIYFYQKKKYLKIIYTYGRKRINRRVNIVLTLYVFISLISIFIVGFIRLLI